MEEKSVAQQKNFLIEASHVRFEREDDDHVYMITSGGRQEVGTITMAFPLSNRGRMIVVRNAEGEEIGILDNLKSLDAASRRIANEEMEKSYFLPRIQDVFDVTEKLGVATWKVQTDRGPRTFQVRRPRQNLRKIGRRRVIIRDVDGNRYELSDWTTLPRRTRRLFEEYL